jgi:hypothetical protein
VSASGQAVAAATGDQFYVTHCVTADSVLNSPGYSVRAASATDDAEALRLALEYPPYELPLDLWREKPGRNQSPRRLARTRHPESGVWVVHSVYLEKDTMNRDRSYFSHLMHLPAATDPATVLRSWDAAGWIKEYPQKADKRLPRGKLPVGAAISDEALSAFLSGSQTGPADLAVAVCPVRLRQNIPARRELVARCLQAIVLHNEEEGERDRLFVHAEPGLVAMLLYAAARLLPAVWTADMTFSTFEPSHRSLRDYKLASIVGTYLGPNAKGLDIDLVTSRGYALDTFHVERSSRELTGPIPSGLVDLVNLVAEGEWGLLADVHKLIGNETDALDRIGKIVPLARAANRLNHGEPTTEDLLALQADARGASALTQRAEKVWPHIRAAALTDARIRTAFKNWLGEPGRLADFRKEAARAIVKGDLAGWDTHWAVVQEVASSEQLKSQMEEALKMLDERLPGLSGPVRARLRAACADACVWPDHHLLASNSLDELTLLLSPQSPAEWQGYACFAVMGPDGKNWLLPATAPVRPLMRERVRKHLLSAPPAVLGGYLKQARPYISTVPAFLYDLLIPITPASVAFLDRLIDGGAAVIDAADWVKLLSDLNVYNAKEWEGFLFANDHLAKLLGGFRADPAATGVWKNYLDLLSAELFEGDEWETELYRHLSLAKQTLGAAGIPLKAVLPEGGPSKLNAIELILTVMADPGQAANLSHGELLRAFQWFWPEDPLAGLRKIYHTGHFDTLALPDEASRLEPFIAAFQACFPVTHEYYTARTAVTQWLAISESCPDESRVEFQVHFVREYVMKEWHRDLLEENRRVPFIPEAKARIQQDLIMASRPSGERYAAPSGGGSSSEDTSLALPATKRAKKDRARGRGRRQRGSGGMSAGGLALAVIILLVIVAVVVIALVKFSGNTKPTEPESHPDHAPPKTKVKATAK